MGKADIIRFDSDRELAHAAARRWLDAVAGAAPQQVALSGGRIARTFFDAVAEAARVSGVSLRNVHFFWADERCVPPDDPESNFLLAQRHLLEPLGVSGESVHRIRGELGPQGAATEAAEEVRRNVPAGDAGLPVLDHILLGMGEDGHVASLFPGEPCEVADSPELFRAVVAAKPPPRRITMGYGLLRVARRVWVLASGAGKEQALRDSLRPEGLTPLGRVIQMRDSTLMLTDIRGE